MLTSFALSASTSQIIKKNPDVRAIVDIIPVFSWASHRWVFVGQPIEKILSPVLVKFANIVSEKIDKAFVLNAIDIEVGLKTNNLLHHLQYI